MDARGQPVVDNNPPPKDEPSADQPSEILKNKLRRSVDIRLSQEKENK